MPPENEADCRSVRAAGSELERSTAFSTCSDGDRRCALVLPCADGGSVVFFARHCGGDGDGAFSTDAPRLLALTLTSFTFPSLIPSGDVKSFPPSNDSFSGADEAAANAGSSELFILSPLIILARLLIHYLHAPLHTPTLSPELTNLSIRSSRSGSSTSITSATNSVITLPFMSCSITSTSSLASHQRHGELS